MFLKTSHEVCKLIKAFYQDSKNTVGPFIFCFSVKRGFYAMQLLTGKERGRERGGERGRKCEKKREREV
jgi:hypothetical protein